MRLETMPRIPDPDYDHHPAYGPLFGQPGLLARFKALAHLLPHLAAYTAYAALVERSRRAAAADAPPLAAELDQNGAVAVRFTPDERAAIKAAFTAHLAVLQRKRAAGQSRTRTEAAGERPRSARRGEHGRSGRLMGALHARLNRASPNELFIYEADDPALFKLLRAAFEEHGVLDAASRYHGRKVDVSFLKLVHNEAADTRRRLPFDDLGLPEPPGTFLHVDHLWTTKCLLYVSEVEEDNGPFCYCLGSNGVRIGFFEGALRRANDRARLSDCDLEHRRLFHALPPWLRKKAKFGNDLERDAPALAELLAREKRFTSADGDLILFDDRGIHRGGLVRSGARTIVQIRLA